MATHRIATALALIGAGSALFSSQAVCQEWYSRDDRPLFTDATFANGGPDDRALLVRHGAVHAWRGRSWQRIAPYPNALVMYDFAFDRGRDRVVLVGGPTLSSTSIQTYELVGSSWVEHPGVRPGMASWYELYYDPSLGAVVAMTEPTPGQTQDYVWSGVAWNALPAGVRPPQVRGQIVADHGRSRLVAFTPEVPGPGGQTWEWNGAVWAQLAPVVAPSIRSNAAMAYDELANRVTLVGGDPLPTPTADMWRWDGVIWSPVSSTTAPTSGVPARLTFDRTRGALVLMDRSSSLGRTWEWDGSDWSQVNSGPSHTAWYSTAFDPSRGRLVHYDGLDTLDWDGISWLSTGASGPARRATQMAFDPGSNELVVHGGWVLDVTRFPPLSNFSDTWTFANSAWTQRVSGISPGQRHGHALVTRWRTSDVMLFGGADQTGALLDDTWSYSNGTWVDLTRTLPTQPPAGWAQGANDLLGTDPFVFAGGQVWQFDTAWRLISSAVPVTSGGLAISPVGNPLLVGSSGAVVATYEYVGSNWLQRADAPTHLDQFAYDSFGVLRGFAQGEGFVYTGTPAAFKPLGAGCGAPVPTLTVDGLPLIGNGDFRCVVEDVQGFAILAADFATQPVPLGNGCTSHLPSPFPLTTVVPNQFGIASLKMPIPRSTAFRGLDFYLQAVTPQVGGPFAGFAFSGAIRVTVGN